MKPLTFSAQISYKTRKATQTFFDAFDSNFDGNNVRQKFMKSRLRPLVENGDIDLGATDNTGNTPLHVAAQFKGIGIVQSLLNQGADPNVADQWNCTPLHYTGYNANTEIVQCLLDHGADTESTSYYGEKPLHFAARLNNHGALRLLLDHGADVNPSNKEGYTPLHFALSCNTKEKVKNTAGILFQNGANIHVRAHDGKSAKDYLPNIDTAAFDAWHDGSLEPQNLTKENVMQMLSVWPLDNPQAEVPRFEQLDAIFKDARWEDEHAEHKLDLIQQIPCLTSREQMFLMGGHARALMQKQRAEESEGRAR